MSWKGVLKHLDLGPGQYVLETEDGRQVPLYGEVPNKLVGRKVVVDGTSVEGFGFAMTGESAAIEVKAVRTA